MADFNDHKLSELASKSELLQGIDSVKGEILRYVSENFTPLPPKEIAPVANNDESLLNPYGSTVTVNVTKNDTDEDGAIIPSTVSLLEPAGATEVVKDYMGNVVSLVIFSEGKWSVNSLNGVVSFVPRLGYNGNPAPLFYVVKDNKGNVSNPASIRITYLAAPAPVPDVKTCKAGPEINQVQIVNSYNFIPRFHGENITDATLEVRDKAGKDLLISHISNKGNSFVVATKDSAAKFKPDSAYPMVKLSEPLKNETYCVIMKATNCSGESTYSFNGLTGNRIQSDGCIEIGKIVSVKIQ